MVPSGVHAATPTQELSVSVCRFAPFNSTVFNFPPAKKPRERLSGDQNGDAAPSVPGMAEASLALRERVHNLITAF